MGRGRTWRFDCIRQSSLKKLPNFCDAIPGFPVKLDILRIECRNSILMTQRFPRSGREF